MSGLFGSLGDDPRMLRQALKSRYNAARINLLLMIIFTVVNITTLILSAGGYFLFSAAVPYLLVFVGMLLCGMFPDEMYSEDVTPDMFQDKSLFAGAMVIAALIVVIYLLLWFFSRKGRVAFLITAFVLFAVDTVVLVLFGGLMANFFMDLLFHIWLLVMLGMGIKAHKRLAALPKEEVIVEAEYTDISEEYEYEDEYCGEEIQGEIEAPETEESDE